MAMDDARRGTVERAFAHPAFLASRRSAAAAILLAGSPLRVVWANMAGAALFEARDYAQLGERLLRSDPGSARRLDHLAARIGAGAAPRLERLRFMWGFTPRSLTLLCARIEGDDDVLALAAASPGEVACPWDEEAAGSPTPFSIAPASAPAAIVEAPAAPESARSSGGDTLARARQTLHDAAAGTARSRFVWRTDAHGRLGEIDQALFERLGLGWRPLGLGLVEAAARIDPAGAETLAQSLARHATFSGLDIDVPLANHEAVAGLVLRLPVSLSGSPVMEPGRRFAGYRGFGSIDLDRLIWGSAPPEVIAESPADAPAAEPQADIVTDPPNPDAAKILPSPVTEPAPPRAANVVHLRPLALVGRGDARMPAGRPAEGMPNPADGAASALGLSESEQHAFKEIGRALGAVTGAAPPADAEPAESPVRAEDGPPARSAIDDPLRHAALLVETTAAGLLVIAHPRVLFANDALLAALRYDSHAALADALGLFFAGRAAFASGNAVTMALPASFGSEDFAAVGRPIAWDGEPAVLWTLQAVAPAELRSSPTPVASHADADLLPILDATEEAVACIDADGRMHLLNRQAAAWFGPDERPQGDLAAMLAPESRTAFTARLAELKADARQDARSRADHVARMANGTMVPVRMTLARLGPDRVSAAWRDLSAEREVEWELSRLKSQAERASGQQPEFLAKVSHEIRTPLNAILGFAEIMIDERFGPLGNGRYKDYLRDIHASGMHVMKLINDLLDLSRIETGRLDLDLGAVDINKIIADCVAQGQPEAHRERVIVRTSLGARLPMVTADDRSARQIVANILSNAVKFNEPGGQVIVSSALNETGTVVVRIRDTGIGMTDAEIAAALEPFRQLAPAKSAGGTGLGLPLTRALVLANGASLSIRSHPREGTMVEVTFQTSAVPAARVPA